MAQPELGETISHVKCVGVTVPVAVVKELGFGGSTTEDPQASDMPGAGYIIKYCSVVLNSGKIIKNHLNRSVGVDIYHHPDSGWGVARTIGMALDNGFRLENELVYRTAAARGSAESLWALGWLVNIWDIRNKSSITPYLGGGFGIGLGRVASPGPVDNYGQGVAYQAGVDWTFVLITKCPLMSGFVTLG